MSKLPAQPGWCANGHTGFVRKTRFAPDEPEFLICDDCNGIAPDAVEMRSATQANHPCAKGCVEHVNDCYSTAAHDAAYRWDRGRL